MTLLVTVLGAVAVGTSLVVSLAVRSLRRLGHRCAEQTRPSSCERCAAVVRGEDRGGHMVCACGEVSPHLAGADLLAWSANHHGETLPALPGPADASARGAVAEAADVPVRSTTRGRAAAEAEGRVRQGLDEELSETQRRMIDRARRNPDPITPQLLREAEEFGVRPAAAPAPEGAEATPVAPAAPVGPADPDADGPSS